MPKTGYSDYQRVGFASGELIFGLNAAVTATSTFNLENLTSWPFINFTTFCPNPSDSYRFLFQWFTDGTFTNSVGTDNFDLFANCSAFVCVAVKTPFCQLTIIPHAGGNATVIHVACYGTPQYCPASAMFHRNLIAVSLFNGIAISGVDNFATINILDCDYYLGITTNSANPVTVEVQMWRNDLAIFSTYMHYDNVSMTNPVRERIPAPAAIINVKVTNGAVAAQNILGVLSPLIG